jgi:hypothetical protein
MSIHESAPVEGGLVLYDAACRAMAEAKREAKPAASAAPAGSLKSQQPRSLQQSHRRSFYGRPLVCAACGVDAETAEIDSRHFRAHLAGLAAAGDGLGLH